MLDGPGVGDDGQAAPASIGANAAGGAIWVGAGQACRTIFMLVSTLFVARLLTPDDFGVVAMVAPIAAFVLLIQDLGLSQAVIQARKIDDDNLNAIFWLNIVLGITIGVFLIAAAPLVGSFYSEPRVVLVVALSAVPALITSATLQHTAILSRQMDFRSLAFSDFANAVFALVSSIVFAYMLRSYWAIWLGQLAGLSAQAGVLWLRSVWRPRLSLKLSGIGDYMRFGGGVTGYNVMNYVVRNMDNVIIARQFGSAALGAYDQSYKLMMAPMQAINSPLSRVMMPVLSRLIDDPVRYRSAFVRVVKALLFVLTPALAVLVAMSNDVVVMLLGSRWIDAGPIFLWLSLTGLLQPIANATGWLFLSVGRTRQMFYWAIFSAVVTAIGFLVGLKWGPVGVAASLFVTLALRMPILFWWSTIGTGVKTTDMYRALVEPAAGTVLSIIATMLFRQAGFSEWWLLSLSGFTSYLIAVLLLTASAGGREFLQSSYGVAKALASGLPSILKRR